MAKPRVFISSTYSDLAETRDKVSGFVSNCGYEPVSFEKNDIPFKPDKSLEESCYDEVKECSMFILLLKSSFGQPTSIKYLYDIKIPKEIKSITQLEYLVARKIGIPIFIFIHQDSISEYNAFKKLDFPTDFEFKYLDGINHANFVKEIFIDSNERYLFNFKSFTDINDTLKKQWAGLFNSYLTNFRVQKLKSNSLIPINCYKLFYLRKNIGLTQKNLADRAGISESTVQNLEDVGLHFNRIDTKG